MKVLLLTTHLNIGGVSSYTLNLAHGLKKMGIPVWIASSGGELVEKLKREGIPHIKINVKTKFEFNPKLITTFFKLRFFIKKNGITIIHAQTRVTQVLGNLLALSTGVGYLSTCHGFFKTKRLSRRAFPSWGRNVIAISDAVKDHLVEDFHVKEENVSLIYTGVDCGEFSRDMDEDEKGAIRHNLGFVDKTPIVGSVSRFSPVKGLRYLLLAMKDILKDIPEAHLLLVGEGPSKQYLMNLAKNLGIEKNVFFAESTTKTQRFLSIIDVFVFYSLEEGLGLSLLEAMAAGKPCVASNVGGVSSVIEDNVTGVLVPPKDTHALKEAIIKVIRNKNLRRSIAKKGKLLAKDKFSIDRMIREVIGVYEKTNPK